MEKGGLRWKRCPGRAGSILAAEPLPLLAAAGGLGSGSRAPGPPWVSQCSREESGIISSAAPLPFGSIAPLPSPSVPSRLEHPGLFQPRLPTLQDLFNPSQSEWKIGDVQPGLTALAGMGWAGGCEQTGGRRGGERRAAALHPRCIAVPGTERGVGGGQGARVTPWVFITTCYF